MHITVQKEQIQHAKIGETYQGEDRIAVAVGERPLEFSLLEATELVEIGERMEDQ